MEEHTLGQEMKNPDKGEQTARYIQNIKFY